MTHSTEPIVRLDHVCKSFGGMEVLRDLCLDVQRGQTTVIIGPSGCGKTVLLRHIVLLVRPDSGRVFFDGADITDADERDLVPVRRRMGFLFQSGALFDSMTVAENIHFPLIEHGTLEAEALESRCRQVLRLVGLDGLQGRMPENLSGGQRKRVALARAIALNPELILYDEPTTGLDPIRADLINELILKLKKELKITAVVVTHDMASARKVGDRIVMLDQGRILLDTTPAELEHVTNETVVRFVQGRASPEELDELTRGRVEQKGQP